MSTPTGPDFLSRQIKSGILQIIIVFRQTTMPKMLTDAQIIVQALFKRELYCV
jgi:hypothetical protein